MSKITFAEDAWEEYLYWQSQDKKVEESMQERERGKTTMWKCPKCGREFKKKEQSHYCGEKPKTIDEYILSQDADKQEELQHIRQILRSALPEAEERISWSMPTYWKKREIISILDEQGIFQFKDSVMQVAELLTVSKNTVYLHLRNLHKK